MQQLKNIREGSGEVLDTAAALRELPDILDNSMNRQYAHLNTARGIADLSDEVYSMARVGLLDEPIAALIGQKVGDKSLHKMIADTLLQKNITRKTEASYAIDQMIFAGKRVEETGDLFGDVVTRSLWQERSQIMGEAEKFMRENKRLFNTLSRHAQAIENAGNALNRGANSAIKDKSAQALQVLEKLATRAGPVSDALERAANQLVDGAKRNDVTKAFLKEFNDLVDKHGILSLADIGTPVSKMHTARAIPSGLDEPTGKMAQEFVETNRAIADMSLEKLPEDAGLFDVVPIFDKNAIDENTARFASRAQLQQELKTLDFLEASVQTCFLKL